MARVMICDDDRAAAEQLVRALRAAGHEAEACRHTMDVLRAAARGDFDLIAVGLDMAGFGRSGALAALDRAGQLDLDLGPPRGGLELPLCERRAADQGD